ncbi:MAG: OsmC family protein, partial [Thermoleophilaceae bacterium]
GQVDRGGHGGAARRVKFAARTSWTGSTGEGWEHYDRTHEASVSEQTVSLTTAEGKGDPRLANPELLLLAAASSCQMLWFLHLAAKARIDVTGYEDDCEAEMPDDRLTRIVLRPRITIAGEFSKDRAMHLCELAHKECNIAKSLSCPVVLEPHLV